MKICTDNLELLKIRLPEKSLCEMNPARIKEESGYSGEENK